MSIDGVKRSRITTHSSLVKHSDHPGGEVIELLKAQGWTVVDVPNFPGTTLAGPRSNPDQAVYMTIEEVDHEKEQ